MPVWKFPFTISGELKIEAEDAEDAKEKLAEQNLTIEEYAAHGALEVDEDPTLEQVE